MTRFVLDGPVAIHLVDHDQTVPDEHALLAPAALRSEVLATLFGQVRSGERDERDAKRVLDGIRALRLRLLGDRVLQAHAWQVASALGWPDTYRAEYIALTRLQADALVTLDDGLASAARTLVPVATVDELLGR